MKKHSNKSTISITDSRIENYAEKMTSDESEALRKLVSSSDQELEFIDMLSGKLVGQLLKLLINISGAKKILEIGTFTGYSALTMAEALPEDGKVITLEMNIRYQKLAAKHFEEFDHHKKIKLLKGNALELMDEITDEFDLVFLDADKINYPFYFEKVLPLITEGGLLVADNTLWDGTVLEPKNPKSEAIHDFNKLVANNERVEQVLLPIRDGISLIRKK